MRISVIAQGGKRRLVHRFKLMMMRLFMGESPPDVIKTMTYRADYFGDAFANAVQGVLRGDSPWSAGERELFAAFTSKANQCLF